MHEFTNNLCLTLGVASAMGAAPQLYREGRTFCHLVSECVTLSARCPPRGRTHGEHSTRHAVSKLPCTTLQPQQLLSKNIGWILSKVWRLPSCYNSYIIQDGLVAQLLFPNSTNTNITDD